MLLFLKNKHDALFEHAGQRNATAFLERLAVAQVRCTTTCMQSMLAELRVVISGGAALPALDASRASEYAQRSLTPCMDTAICTMAGCTIASPQSVRL